MAWQLVSRRLLQRSSLLQNAAGIADQLLGSAGASTSAAPRAGAQLFSTSASRLSSSAETISVTFTDEKDGSVTTVQAPVGESLLEVAHHNDIDLEGACEGSLACSTCHVIVEDQEYFDRLPEPEDDENDMLDLAFALTDTSRLGCQIRCAQDLDGLRVRIPSATRNFAVDGFVPKPH